MAKTLETVALPSEQRVNILLVDDRVENFRKVFQGQSVHHEECRRHAPLVCLLLRPADRLGEEVDARDLLASAGEEQGVLPGAASGVKDGAGDPVGLSPAEKRWKTREIRAVKRRQGAVPGPGSGRG